jgi:hypothetical protein
MNSLTHAIVPSSLDFTPSDMSAETSGKIKVIIDETKKVVIIIHQNVVQYQRTT